MKKMCAAVTMKMPQEIETGMDLAKDERSTEKQSDGTKTAHNEKSDTTLEPDG